MSTLGHNDQLGTAHLGTSCYFWYSVWLCAQDTRALPSSHKPPIYPTINNIYALFLIQDNTSYLALGVDSPGWGC